MIEKKVYRSREEWLAERTSGFIVGSSNIGTILGLNEYETPYQMWHAYKNGEGKEVSERMHRGRFMEDAIANWFEFETGFKVIKRSSEIAVFKNDKYQDYIQVSPDRELFADGAKKRPLVEIKDTAYRIDFENPDTLPKTWYAQIQYQLGVMERDLCYLVVNDGSKSLRYFPFLFDAPYFDAMMKEAIEWVERYIIGDDIPELTNSEDLRIAFPTVQSKSKSVGESFKCTVYEKLIINKQAAKIMDAEIERLSQKLKIQFEDCDTLDFEGQTIATYKPNSKGIRTLKLY